MIKHVASVFVVLLVLVGMLGMGRHGQAKVPVSNQQDAVDPSTREQLYPVEVAGKYGFINSKGEFVIDPIYDGAGYPSLPGDPVYVEDRALKKQIYYSVTGDKLFECPLNTCGILYEGLALYSSKIQNSDGTAVTRYGYINEQGEIAIQPIYHQAFNFKDGLARVNQGKAAGYINTAGKLVIPFRYSLTTDFSEGLAAVMLNVGGKYGYIDPSGKSVVPPKFDYAQPFSNDAAVVYVNGKYGYIDKAGNYILKPQFSMAQPFSEGLALVERNGVTFVINKKGQKIIQNITAAGMFSGGLAPASRGQEYGFINTSGAFVVKPFLEWANTFSGDLAVVYLKDSESPYYVSGYMNRSGEIVWPPQ
jgi:hypothetical protein